MSKPIVGLSHVLLTSLYKIQYTVLFSFGFVVIMVLLSFLILLNNINLIIYDCYS
jgi:hypothetical protein